MGGKKKGLANRLAKMSDEERARYMQMKADQEEEARRRKEQLVQAFMKNKIKREENFARLNKAKINQQWHQFMRLRKCREMKENCEHTKKWVERVVALKNRTIDNLMKELDEAEFQYSTNLQAHLQHVDHFIDFHRKYFQQIHNEYQNDLDFRLDEAIFETNVFKERSTGDIEHLKTLVFGQEVAGRGFVKDSYNYYLKSKEEFIKECKDEFKNLRKKNCETTGTIWRDISELLRDYVSKTDKRRAQLADMKRLDAESAAEINQNQERIDFKEIEIERLKDEYITLIRTRKNVIRSLEAALKVVGKQSLSAKQSLQAEITLDGKKLRVLTDISKQCLTELEKLVTRGEYMLQLMQSCRRFETEKEKVLKFADFSERIRGTTSSDGSEESDSMRNKDVEEVFMKVQMESIESKDDDVDDDIDDDDEEIKAGISDEIKPERRVRIIEETKKYKILIKHKYKPKITKSAQIVVGEKLKKELDLVAMTSWKCPKKRSKSNLLQTESLDDYDRPKTGIIEDNIDCLMNLEPLWFLYNKVKLDYVELRKEKASLIQENEMMKQTIKSILEDAVLKTRDAPKAALKIRYLSAPPK